jgi:hypothetical protein
VGQSGPSRVVALWFGGCAASFALVALVVGMTSQQVCPPNYVVLIDPRIEVGVASAVILILATIALIAAANRQVRHVVAAVVGIILSPAAVAVLFFAVDVHRGHITGCWTF